MSASFTNGTAGFSKDGLTAAQYKRLIEGVCGAESIDTTAIDANSGLTVNQKVAAKAELVNTWLFRYLKNDAKSYEARTAASTAATTAETELP